MYWYNLVLLAALRVEHLSMAGQTLYMLLLLAPAAKKWMSASASAAYTNVRRALSESGSAETWKDGCAGTRAASPNSNAPAAKHATRAATHSGGTPA